jgi:CTP:molybdopterin cytidylyltransferase MocA
VLADGPRLDPRAVERLLAHRRDADVVVASYDGTRDHPAVLAREVWSDVPDEGARALEATLVSTDDLDPPGDFDYPPSSSSNSVS